MSGPTLIDRSVHIVVEVHDCETMAEGLKEARLWAKRHEKSIGDTPVYYVIESREGTFNDVLRD